MKVADVSEQIETHIFGSGALSWDWWTGARRVDDSTWEIESCDPDWFDQHALHVVTNQDLFAAARELLSDDIGSRYARLGFLDFTMMNWDNLDLDADSADLILQQACFGEILYG